MLFAIKNTTKRTTWFCAYTTNRANMIKIHIDKVFILWYNVNSRTEVKK